MSPKVDVDVKLAELRDYVVANLESLASRRKETLKQFFASKKNSKEASFYFFVGERKELHGCSADPCTSNAGTAKATRGTRRRFTSSCRG